MIDSALILTGAVIYAQMALGFACLMAAFRVMRGPRAQDRILGIDALYVNGMLLTLVIGIRSGSNFFFEAAAVIAILGFTATVALAKFLLRGELIE